jgi:hypothetical protein
MKISPIALIFIVMSAGPSAFAKTIKLHSSLDGAYSFADYSRLEVGYGRLQGSSVAESPALSAGTGMTATTRTRAMLLAGVGLIAYQLRRRQRSLQQALTA